MHPDSDPTPVVLIGVGIDTARYGHHVTFLNADLQHAAAPLEFQETYAGYLQLRNRFELLHQRFPTAEFHIRLDVASSYAANLEAFLRQLPFTKVLSIGEPTRNKRYRDVHFPKRKSDATESYAAARFALIERPKAAPETDESLRLLREIASRLEAQTRQTTRFVNQFHNLLARVFPELALIAVNVGSNWVLQLLAKYPTPAKIANARPASIEAVPYLPAEKVQPLLAAARDTIASLTGSGAEALVLGLVRQIRQSNSEEQRVKKLLVTTYEKRPHNHLATIPGIGKVTAAVLTAKIGSIDRFERPEQLVGYFGIFPEQHSSGMDPNGQSRPGHKMPMSKRGNDLVRSYLYMAAMSAIRFNPAAIALYRRLASRGIKGNKALGHVMRKLLHLVFAVWKTDRPFDPEHYPWAMPKEQEPAAGRTQELNPAKPAVTATGPLNVNTPSGEVNGLLNDGLPSADSCDSSVPTNKHVARREPPAKRERAKDPSPRTPPVP